MLTRRISNSLKKQDWLAITIDIIILVIGVFLGIQVANLNEDLQQRSYELELYGKIKEQLEIDSQDIEGQKHFNARYKNEYSIGIDIIENDDRSRIGRLAEIAGGLTNYSDFDRTGNIYENLVNSGDTKLIQNDEVVKALLRLEETLLYMNRMESIHYEAMMKYAVDSIKDVIKFSDGEVKKPESLYSYEFQNLFVLFKRIANEKEFVYNRALKEIEELNMLLTEELNDS